MNMLTHDDKEEIAEIVVEIMKDVLFPVLEDMNKKLDDMVTKDELNTVEHRLDKRIDSLEKNLGDKIDRLAGKVDSHEVRITRLESKTAVS